MNLKTLAQAALATIIANHPEAVVTVVANGRTTQAVRDTSTSDADLQVEGEKGLTTGRVHCNADTIGIVTQGQSITVDGTTAFAMRVRTDSMGAITTVDYTSQKPK